MSRTVVLVVGAVLLVAGVVFGLQGLGLVGGSGGMNGKTIWAVLGPIIAIVGLVILARGLRRRRG